MKVEFRKSFTRDLKNVSDKSILKRVLEAVENLEKVENLNSIPNLRKMKGADGFFRIKFGDYRLGFALENETIIFVRFLNRKDIYKFFP